jgi:probable O-glycosylation ligase (exosortase A-associated)
MRDYLLLAIILGSLPLCLVRPFIGVLVWTWVSFMNPHRLTWSIAYDFPVAQYVALATLLGVPFAKERQWVPLRRETILYVLLWAAITFSTFLAIYPADAWLQWKQTSKILLMSLLPIFLITDLKRLRLLLLTIALSIGFYGAKGGIFGIVTGGEYRVWGPAESFIADNNDLALAMNMTLPLLYYLAREERRKLLKYLLYCITCLTIIAIFFTYSRGGMITLAIIIGFFLLKTRRKFLTLAILSIGIGALLSFAPDKWLGRMGSMQQYAEGQALDASSAGRLNAWEFAWNLAKDRPLTGGGFGAFTRSLFAQYAPDPANFHDAHSIFFELLGEQGFPALFLFLLLIASAFWSLSRIAKEARRFDELHWAKNYVDMLHLSLMAYVVGGIFLGRAYFDYFYTLIAAVVILGILTQKSLAVEHAEG